MAKILTPENPKDKAVYRYIELDRQLGEPMRGTIYLEGMCTDEKVQDWYKTYQEYKKKGAPLPDIKAPVSGDPAACDFVFGYQGGDPASVTLEALRGISLVKDTAGWKTEEKSEEAERGDSDVRVSKKPRASSALPNESAEEIRPLPAYLESAPIVRHMQGFKRDSDFVALTLESAEGKQIEGDIYLTSNDRLDPSRLEKKKIPETLKIAWPRATRDGKYAYHFTLTAPPEGTVTKDDVMSVLRTLNFIPEKTVWKSETPSPEASQDAAAPSGPQESAQVHRLLPKAFGGYFQSVEVHQDDITPSDVSGKLIMNDISPALQRIMDKPDEVPSRFGRLLLSPPLEKNGKYEMDFIAHPGIKGGETLDSAAMLAFAKSLFTDLKIAPLSADWEEKEKTQPPQEAPADAGRSFTDLVASAPTGKPARALLEIATTVTDLRLHRGAGPLVTVQCVTSTDPSVPLEGTLTYRLDSDFTAERILGDLNAASRGSPITIGAHEIANVNASVEGREIHSQRLTVRLTGKQSGREDVMKILEQCPGHCEAGNFLPIPQREGSKALSH